MANATLDTIGQINQAGATDAIFLKVFSGEVLTAFEQLLTLKGKVLERQITSGKSAQFPAMGRIAAAYHTPGTEIVGVNNNHAEVVVTIDDLLLASDYIASIDEAKNHYDVRGPIATEIGRALANAWDKHLVQMAALAARAAATVTGLPSGTRIFTDTAGAPGSADYVNDGMDLAAGLFLAAESMDNNSVPEEGRTAIVKPRQYYSMAQNTTLINKQWGGAGAYSDGKILRVAGFDIVKTIHSPAGQDLSAVTDVRAGTNNKYRGNFTHLAAVCMHMSAIGTVKLMDLATEMAWDIRRQATLLVGKYAVGHGILRPEAAVTIEQTVTGSADA